MRTNKGSVRAAALIGFLLFSASGLMAEPYAARGVASWYGAAFQGRKTASGEIFDRFKYTAAHRSLPFGTLLLVTLESSGKRVVVRVNDRGPFVGGRLIDLSEAAASSIGLEGQGIGQVTLEEVVDFPPGPVSGAASEVGKAAVAGAILPSPKPSPESAAMESWCDIQVASFSKKKNAENSIARLKAAGYLPEMQYASGYYRVLLKRLPADRAESERKRLEDLGFPRVMVTLYQIAKDR